MNYWLDLFTGKTWKEFRDSGANISGFRQRRRNTVKSIQPGDILLCYLTGVMRWVGALEVIGQSDDKRKIWTSEAFTERLSVRPIILLDPEYGIPMEKLEGKLDFYSGVSDRHFFKGFLRGSPAKLKKISDGELLLTLLMEAEKNPIKKPVDQKLLNREPRIPLYKVSQKSKGKEEQKTVSVPDESDVIPKDLPEKASIETQYSTDHVMIQYRLLTLGAEMGLDLWVARNDRSKIYNGKTLGNLPNTVQELPAQFNDATQRTIELIDVLWLKGNSIIAAFEVETTTSIYSGLLRMSDLLALQPNLNIRLYLVAPEERRNKVEQEILRPTFQLKEKPLSQICGFISTSELNDKIEGITKLGVAKSLKSDFLDTLAEYFGVGDT